MALMEDQPAQVMHHKLHVRLHTKIFLATVEDGEHRDFPSLRLISPPKNSLSQVYTYM